MEEMVRRWVAAAERADAERDWAGNLGPFYTDDAFYGWNVGPREEFEAHGKQQISEWALGLEMEGLDGWVYPYQRVLIDEKQGEVLAFWKQVAPHTRPDGSTYEVRGLGGSWFRYAGDYKWCWQMDFFDFGNVSALFVELIQAGHLSDPLKRRLERAAAGELPPGHVKRKS
jgi:hypothetical protein